MNSIICITFQKSNLLTNQFTTCSDYGASVRNHRVNEIQVSKFIGQNIHSLLTYKQKKQTISEIWRERERYSDEIRV